jgi:hypothetical protein
MRRKSFPYYQYLALCVRVCKLIMMEGGGGVVGVGV